MFEFRHQTSLLVSHTLLTMHVIQIPSDLSGQKAEQRANGISFHALPPQIQMFTPKNISTGTGRSLMA